LRLEARVYIILALDLLGLLVAQSVFSGLKSSAQILDTGSIILSPLASFFTGFELGLQIIGAFLSTT
jgi:hypothetical protein